MREHAAEGPATKATDEPVVVALPSAVAAPLTPPACSASSATPATAPPRRSSARAPTATATTLAIGATGSKVTSSDGPQHARRGQDGARGRRDLRPDHPGAVRQFQSAHPPLKATGVVDADTEAAIAEAGTEEQDQTEIARKLFALGAKAYERGKYGHAYAFFTRAGELAARPALPFSRAQALRKLGGRRKEAIALYEAYLLTENPTRKADAEAGLAELKPRRPATRRPTPTRAARTSARAPRSTSGATTLTPPTSSRSPASTPTAPRCCSHARRRCASSAAGATRRSRSTRPTSPPTARPARPTPSRRSRSSRTTPSGDSDADAATAKGHFNKGAAQYERGKFGHAYDQFTMAGELADRPALLFSRAQALRKLGGRESEAIALYEQYIEAAGEGGNRVEDAQQMLELLRTHGAAP